MKKIYLYSILTLAVGLLAACAPNSVEEVGFDVTLENNAQEIYAGDAVTFNFSGNPDYIIFYSGGNGNKYANKNRLEVDVESAKLSYAIKQQYTQTPHLGLEIMSIYISEDFSGSYSSEELAKATWAPLSGTGDGLLKVPTKSESVSDAMDIAAYTNKKFYLAFRYHAPAVVASTHPRVDVSPLAISKKLADGSEVLMNDPQTEFGFSYVFVKATKNANFSASSSSLLFQPQDKTSVEIDVWAVSKQMELRKVSPDMGVPIKALNMKTASYTHIYDVPGEYTVSLVASNTNQWNSKSVVREMKITVKEKVTGQ